MDGSNKYLDELVDYRGNLTLEMISDELLFEIIGEVEEGDIYFTAKELPRIIFKMSLTLIDDLEPSFGVFVLEDE